MAIEVLQSKSYENWFASLRDVQARDQNGGRFMKKTKLAIRKWDPAALLDTRESVMAYLDAAFEDGDPALIAAAIGDVARAVGMTKVSSEASLGRESLYKALSKTGNPEFATVIKVLAALGLKLQAVPAHEMKGASAGIRHIAA